jgi:uncharacterized protein (TIGR03118 family)
MSHTRLGFRVRRTVIFVFISLFAYWLLAGIPFINRSSVVLSQQTVNGTPQSAERPEFTPVAGYRQTNLVSDVTGIGLLQDPFLVNPWGITLTSSSPFWVANNGTSTSTLYQEPPGGDTVSFSGLRLVTIPGQRPTGTVANGTADFVVTNGSASGPARFIFASLTGNITGWNPNVPAAGSTTAQIAASHPGHVYTGLALGSNIAGNHLYAADFANGAIDVYSPTFALESPASFPFADPTIPAGYHPFNITNLGGSLYVAYAKVGPDGRSENGPGFGFVRRFNTNGVRDLTFGINNGPLDAPWGMVISPATFGTFSNALLVGNFSDEGRINAFNASTGAFLGTLADQGGNPIEIDELWALTFGNGENGGDTNALYFTAGIAEEEHGLFGSIRFVNTPPPALFQFSSDNFVVGENSGRTNISVIRTGDVSSAATVNFAALPVPQPGQAVPGSPFREGTPLAAEVPVTPPTPFPSQSYERKPGGTAGNTQDTGNNAADFQLISAINPQNLASALTPPSGTASTSTGVVISEFRTFGPGPIPVFGDQFVELYNNTNAAVDISGWKLKAASFGIITTVATINAGTTIPARGHFLLTRAGGYTGAIPGDLTYAQDFFLGGMALTRADDSIVDQVAEAFSDGGNGDLALLAGTLTFAPGETSKSFPVAIFPDSFVEGTETIDLVLSNPSDNTGLTTPSIATLTILDATGTPAASPAISISDMAQVEGNSGSSSFVFNVSLNAPSALAVTVDFATANGSATSGSDYTSRIGSVSFAPNETTKTVSIQVSGDGTNEPDETFFVNLSNAANATIADAQGIGVILNDDAPAVGVSPTFTVVENAGTLSIAVTRGGDATVPGTVDFATADGTASQQSDYIIANGTLSFAAGEMTKNVVISIIDDVKVEGSETFTFSLSNPTGGVVLGSANTSTITITDNDTVAPTTNPIDDPNFFVRQQYLDFLNREPDPGGLAFWAGKITACGSDASCITQQRVGVSAAFFRSAEFQETGFFVYRTYKAAFGGAAGSTPTYLEFTHDRSLLTFGPGLEASKQAFINNFVTRSAFTTALPPSLTNAQYVDQLNSNAGTSLTPAERDALVLGLDTGTQTRVTVLRAVVDNAAFKTRETNPAFVLMQYFGYLRRDRDPSGFSFWLNILNTTNNFNSMVCAFINSAEYQQRFSPVVPHNDSVCGAIAP